MSNNVNLDDIKLFVSVVEAGSLSKAAEHLGSPISYISRHLDDLEQSLGTDLMQRTKKGIMLNEFGERFFEKAKEMVQLAQSAIDDIHQDLHKPSGLLKIAVSTEVGRGFLMLHLAEYLRLYPDVNLKVCIDNRKVNMIQDGIDIAFRFGMPSDENIVARKLCDMEVGLFASPNYLAHAPKIESPQDLYQHALIQKYDGAEWIFQHKHSVERIMVSPKLSCNDYNLAGQMVEDGVGIALLPVLNNMVHPHWVRVLPEWTLAKQPIYLIYYKSNATKQKVRSLIDFLLEKISRSSV